MENRSDQTRYLLLIRVPRPTEVAIEDRFLALSGTTKPAMGYHITMAGPFYLAPGQTPAALESLAGICATIPPLHITLNGLGVFGGEEHAVYLRVAGSPNLHRLWRRLRTYLATSTIPQYARLEGDDSFQPHVTLGLHLSDQELNAFCNASQASHFQIGFAADAIWLAEQDPANPWRYVDSYALGRPLLGRPPSHDAVP